MQWRRGKFVLSQVRTAAVRPTMAIEDAIYGVVRTYVGKGGGGALFLGLAKRRLPRIRPTFLEQTDIAALRFDFIERRMEFSRSSLVPRTYNAIPVLDLRIAGAPVADYAARVKRIVVNGEVIALDRPVVAVIDTGTTGLSVSDSLFDSGLLPPQWREARIELATERGAPVALEASIKRRRKNAPPRVAALPTNAEEFDEFPLIVSPVTVPWFDPGFGMEECADGEPFQCNGRPIGQKRSLVDDLRWRSLGLGPAPHVLFVGLAFLWQRRLTIDVDAMRMMIE